MCARGNSPRSPYWKTACVVAEYRPGYEAVLTATAVRFVTGLTRRNQRKLLDRVQELSADPFLAPDFRTTDSAGREISHLLIDDFIYDYWVDHASRQVVITEIDFVE